MNMKTQKHDSNGTSELWLALAVGLAVAASASAQTAVTNDLVPLDPQPGDGATQAYGLLGWETTEGMFAQITAAPSHAKEYLYLHRIAGTPANTNWSNAIATLAVKGDAFTLRALEKVKEGGVSADQAHAIGLTSAKIHARLAKEGTNPPPSELIARLERAALADIVCHPLEGALVPWALASVRPQTGRPEVMAALEKIQADQLLRKEARGLDKAFWARVTSYSLRLRGC